MLQKVGVCHPFVQHLVECTLSLMDMLSPYSDLPYQNPSILYAPMTVFPWTDTQPLLQSSFSSFLIWWSPKHGNIPRCPMIDNPAGQIYPSRTNWENQNSLARLFANETLLQAYHNTPSLHHSNSSWYRMRLAHITLKLLKNCSLCLYECALSFARGFSHYRRR